MKINGYCKSCGNILAVTEKVTTRKELRARYGITVFKKCFRCGVSNQLLVDDLKAERPKAIRYSVVEVLIVGVIIGLIFATCNLSQQLRLIILAVYALISIPYITYTRKHCLMVQRFNG